LFPRTYLRRWRRDASRVPEVSVAFQLVCACGQPVAGQRRRQHQVIACPSCKQTRFVLPLSPWPDGHGGATGVAISPGRARRPLGYRLVGAGMAALAVMGVLYLGMWPFLKREQPATAAVPREAEVRELITAGAQALGEGNFRVARRRLARAVEWHRSLPPAEQRRLVQLHRQADLLADLLNLTLAEVLQQGLRVHDDVEWQAQFADHRGRAVVFDDVVRRDAAGRPVFATVQVTAGGVQARSALEDLRLLQRLPLDTPQRLLFGARLERCGREEGGAWVIRFQPESGVLLTDPGAAAACCPAPLGDDVLEVLKRQEEWLKP
jgi:hypothetical protein